MKAVLDLTMQDVLKLQATIKNMSDNEYIIHRDRIEGAMVLARAHCDWCSTQDRQSLLSICKRRLHASVSVVKQHVQHLIEEVSHVLQKWVFKYLIRWQTSFDLTPTLQDRICEEYSVLFYNWFLVNRRIGGTPHKFFI